MKSVVVFTVLALSLAFNAALALKLRSPIAPDELAAIEADAGGAAPNVIAGKRAAGATPMAKLAAGKMPGGNWSSLKGDGDLRALAARLRAAGYPDSVVRAIVSGAVYEEYEARFRELSPSIANRPFWTSPSVTSQMVNDPATRAARRDLSREYSAKLKELLGDAPRSPEVSASYRRSYGDIPFEKIEALQQINADYSDLAQQIRSEAQGMTLREDREKLAYLEAEKRKDLERMLTPEELESYLLRTSSTASSLRSRLSAFEPSEQEFRALYKLQEQYDEQFGQYGMAPRNTPEYAQARTAADRKLIEDGKALLGTERGAEFERAMDNTYSQVARVVQRLNLPKESAVAVWELQKETQQRTADLRNNRALTTEQRQAQLVALSQEANAKVSAALGERGAGVYREMGGFWLNNIAPQPAPARGGRGAGGGGGGTLIIQDSVRGEIRVVPGTP